jgi:hypothetical protein
MSRFVLRVGALKRGELNVKRLLAWHDTTLSFLTLLIYSILCLYPILVVLSPLILVGHHLIVQYYEHAKAIAKHGNPKEKEIEKKLQDPAPKLKPVEYKENLQFIQNSMGMYCEAYDWVVLFSRQYFNWDHPEQAGLCLKLVLAALLPTFLIFQWIPINYLALVGGWILFLGNTPLMIALKEVLVPKVNQLAICLWKVLKTWSAPKWNSPEAPMDSNQPSAHHGDRSSLLMKRSLPSLPSEAIRVCIFENQRWWLGLGYINYLLSHEIPAWSNLKGSKGLPPKEAYNPPSGFEFMDTEWGIDTSWSGKVATDPNGWIYFDHQWGSPKLQSGTGSITRRRKWIRHLIQTRAQVDFKELEDVLDETAESVAYLKPQDSSSKTSSSIIDLNERVSQPSSTSIPSPSLDSSASAVYHPNLEQRASPPNGTEPLNSSQGVHMSNLDHSIPHSIELPCIQSAMEHPSRTSSKSAAKYNVSTPPAHQDAPMHSEIVEEFPSINSPLNKDLPLLRENSIPAHMGSALHP